MAPTIVTVVGVGADGWPGLPTRSRAAIEQAEVIAGPPRLLGLMPGDLPAKLETFPAPQLPGVRDLVRAHGGSALVALASGDPMFYGIGAALAELLGPRSVRVLPHPSSASLAAARLGWPLDDVDIVSLAGRPVELLHPLLQPGRRVLALVAEPTAGARVRELLAARGFGASPVILLAGLGGPDEVVTDADSKPHSRLAILAIECRTTPDVTPLPRVPGVPDDAFDHDGQIITREVRALALAALAPLPGQLLWDVGAGSGTVGIEWMRVHPASHAIAIEPRAGRRDRIARNAAALGVPGLQILAGQAPEALEGLPRPNAVFIGAGVTARGGLITSPGASVITAAWEALPRGGRLVVHAVTAEGEHLLAGRQARFGGTLTRLSVERGTFSTWRPDPPVTQWALIKNQPPDDDDD